MTKMEVSHELVERLRQEARIHAQEARTANATIAEIYQICTGSKGEPGNWNGAEPVRQIAEQRAELLEASRAALSAMDSIWDTKSADDEFIYDEMGSELSGAYFRIRAAIANATQQRKEPGA